MYTTAICSSSTLFSTLHSPLYPSLPHHLRLSRNRNRRTNSESICGLCIAERSTRKRPKEKRLKQMLNKGYANIHTQRRSLQETKRTRAIRAKRRRTQHPSTHPPDGSNERRRMKKGYRPSGWGNKRAKKSRFYAHKTGGKKHSTPPYSAGKGAYKKKRQPSPFANLFYMLCRCNC